MQAIYHRFDGIFNWKRGWSMAYLIENEASWEKDHRSTSFPSSAPYNSCLFTSELKNTAFTAIQRRNSLILTTKEWILSTFWGVSAKKNCVSFLKLSQRIGQRLEESLRGDKLVKNFKIFWMNNEIIIEFGFRTKNYADIGGCCVAMGW